MIKSKYRYFPKRFIMNRNEYYFFRLLTSAVGSEYYVVPQVHLDELVKPAKDKQTRLFSFRHINQKSVDFVLCSKGGMKPILAIELDGKSHKEKKNIDRDKEVETILREIGLPLLRFENYSNLDKEELKHQILESVKK